MIEARAKVAQTTLPPDVLTNPEAFKTFEQNQGALTSALSRLMVVVERYPDLKANQNFLSLQSQLEGTENRIAVARRDYIEAVRVYNTELRTFPGRLWAMTLYSGNEPMQTFSRRRGHAEGADRQVLRPRASHAAAVGSHRLRSILALVVLLALRRRGRSPRRLQFPKLTRPRRRRGRAADAGRARRA